jgi:uncharacterized protein involved in cysteine biosynthesis
MFSPRIAVVVGACVILSISCFVGLWYGIDRAIHYWMPEDGGWIASIADMGSPIIAGLLAYFLFPVVTTSFLALFLERIARIVEEQHYPNLPPAAGLPFLSSLLVTVRFIATLISTNVLLLILLPFPPAYAPAWLIINGWLIGREYFEQVAMRRLSRRNADQLRKHRAGQILATGIVLTLLLSIPLFGLVLPVFATCVMVHRFHEWHQSEPMISN